MHIYFTTWHELDLNLLLQAFTPSKKLRSAFLLETFPQFLNQAPPGAQQLVLPDVRNVPHFVHTIVSSTAEVVDSVLTDALSGVPTLRSRSIIGRRDTNWREPCTLVVVQAIRDIDPCEPSNISLLLAIDWTQTAPQSFCLNDAVL